MDNPDVSIIIPTVAGREAVLRRAVASVRERTLSVELIIASTDFTTQSPGLQSSFPHATLRFVSHGGIGNAAGNRNRAIEAARGRHIAFLDDDDEFVEGKVAYQLDLMRRCGAKWAFTNYFLCGAGEERGCTPFSARSMLRRKLDLSENCAIATPTVMIERQLLDEEDLRFDTALSVREDIHLWKQLLELSPALYVPVPLTKVHRGPNSSFLTEPGRPRNRGVLPGFVSGIAGTRRHIADRVDRITGCTRLVSLPNPTRETK